MGDFLFPALPEIDSLSVSSECYEVLRRLGGENILLFMELYHELDLNPTASNTYHNKAHAVGVTALALLFYADKLEKANDLQIKGLIIASMLHDWGHRGSGNKHPDSTNIHIACTKANWFIRTSKVLGGNEEYKEGSLKHHLLDSIVEKAIVSTEYPHKPRFVSEVDAALRDADVCWASLHKDPVSVIVDDLYEEIRVNAKQTHRSCLKTIRDQQANFRKTLVLFTKKARALMSRPEMVHIPELLDRRIVKNEEANEDLKAYIGEKKGCIYRYCTITLSTKGLSR